MVVDYSNFMASDWSYDCRAPLALPLLGHVLMLRTRTSTFPSPIDGRSNNVSITPERADLCDEHPGIHERIVESATGPAQSA